MKLTRVVVFAAVVAALFPLVLSGCSGKSSTSAKSAPAARPDPATIKDAVQFEKVYSALIDEFAAASIKLNGGDVSQMATTKILTDYASALDAAAVQIKASLTGPAAEEFAAKAAKLREQFDSAATSS